MSAPGPMLEIKKAGEAPPPPVMTGARFDLDAILPINRIRQYTKTDDVPHVTDDMLRLFRKAAFEAAEEYTGLILSEQRVVIEAVSSPLKLRFRVNTGMSYTHNTQHPIADEFVWYYGAHRNIGNRQLYVTPGTTTVRIPVTHIAIDASSCCGGPCNEPGINWGMRIMYRAGYKCQDDVPAGILLGCLKFIAWSVMNPGDTVMTVRNRAGAGEAGIIGTNNGAWASGAIEQWRIYVRSAV